MKKHWLLTSCICVTALVACVAARIEYLNVKSDFFLPRQDAYAREWVIPDLDLVLKHMDARFYERRLEAAAAFPEAADSTQATISPGPPYSADEQRALDSMKNLHAAHTSLRWWVSSFGVAQYGLAPFALLMAVVCAVLLSGWSSKSMASLCACLNGASIILMFTRNYWDA